MPVSSQTTRSSPAARKLLRLFENGAVAACESQAAQYLDANPQDADVYHALSIIEGRKGNFKDAAHYLQTAAMLARDNARWWQELALMQRRCGAMQEAIASHRQGVRLRPFERQDWHDYLDTLLQTNDLRVLDPQLHMDLLTMLAIPGLNHVQVARIASTILAAHPDWKKLYTAVQDNPTAEGIAALLENEQLRGICVYPLMLQILQTQPVTTPAFEHVYTLLRHALLADACSEAPSSVLRDLAAVLLPSLAQQCFLNEYVFAQTAGEEALLDKLTEKVVVSDPRHTKAQQQLLLWSCYRPLAELRNIESWLAIAATLPPSIKGILEQQVVQLRQERMLAESMPSLTPICDGVSEVVRSQYESNPYPRWESLTTTQPYSLHEAVQAACPLADIRGLNAPARPVVLVAGCGTGRHALQVAAKYSKAKVTAIDLSRASLAYAQCKQQEAGVTNLQFHQGDILNLPGDGAASYDVIESVGVLHHLQEPMQGWRVLADLLKPGGLMVVGLYSRLARRHILAAQRFIREQGFASDADGIRTARQAIRQQPWQETDKGSPVGCAIFRDFYTTSMCRDLLFHVQEHNYTLPEISDCLRQLGLRLLGISHHDPAVLQRYRERYPDDRQASSLTNWHQFEQDNPDTFAAMYRLWLTNR